MLAELRERELLSVAALVAWLGERGIEINRTLVSHWFAGRAHLPADLLPHLADFTERAECVYGRFVRQANCEVVNLPEGSKPEQEVTHLMLEAGASLGRLQHAIVAARSPESPGGEELTDGECAALTRGLDDFIQQLVDIRGTLFRPKKRRR